MIYLFKMKVVDSYYIEEEEYSMEIFYEYSEDGGDYYSPSSYDLEIKKVLINSLDLTQFYWDFVENEHILGLIREEARDKI